MIRTTTFVLLGLLAAVAGAFVPSAGPSFGKSLLRVSEFVGLVGHRCGFAARCFCTFIVCGMCFLVPLLFPNLLILSPQFHVLPR